MSGVNGVGVFNFSSNAVEIAKSVELASKGIEGEIIIISGAQSQQQIMVIEDAQEMNSEPLIPDAAVEDDGESNEEVKNE